MAKEKIEEVAVNADETALATQEDALAFLLGEMAEEEQPDARRFKMPVLFIYKPGKKYTDKGASKGFVIDEAGSEVEVNIDSLRLHLIDAAPIPQRVMWAYDVETGKRLQGPTAPKDPWCGSSNGVSPRDGELFNYIGKQYVDYRSKQPVTIVKDGCATCPLGSWDVDVVGKDGKVVMEEDHKGVLRAVRATPPCMPTPAYIFYDLDRKTLLLYRAPNFTQRSFIEGTKRSRRFGAVKGISEFYAVNGGSTKPEVVKNGAMYPMRFTVKQVQSDNGYEPVMDFRIDDTPMTVLEVNEVAAIKQLYKEQKIRELISGDLYNSFGSDFNEEVSSASSVGEQPF